MSYIVYGKDDCNYCTLACMLLDNNDIEYTYVDVGVERGKEELLSLATKHGVVVTTVPQILNGDVWVGGYKELSEYVSTVTTK